MAQNQFDPNMLNNLLSQIDPNQLASLLNSLQNQGSNVKSKPDVIIEIPDEDIETSSESTYNNNSYNNYNQPKGQNTNYSPNNIDLQSLLSSLQSQMSQQNPQGMYQNQNPPNLNSLMSMLMGNGGQYQNQMYQNPYPQRPNFPPHMGPQRNSQFPLGMMGNMMGGMPNILSMLGGGGGMGGLGQLPNLMRAMGGMGGRNPMMQMLSRFMGRR
ncbi:hypothetical protein [Clostridium cylindrosporum]|uniref:Uncharacterized protein n=1 Tax=Clostridium cylindrosporum DSM 605 TaxID=1121307 RepID=A0A0J8G503_CLOCY|nr:hypothetical protein [Clostridium cylindrosporum]KMT22751.1 hypothetical protein CLCY_11c00850 [Clostridium cylindrosporum DSM 605]